MRRVSPAGVEFQEGIEKGGRFEAASTPTPSMSSFVEPSGREF